MMKNQQISDRMDSSITRSSNQCEHILERINPDKKQ